MALVVYNTLTRRKEEFKPLNPPKVGMYACGVTVYDTCHVGHARAAVVFDMIFRYLRHKGYDVTYVRNYTDVDDKIIRRANDENVPCEVITERYIKEYEKDVAALGALKPTSEPRATRHIAEMIDTVEKLVDRGLAYEVNGSVYFSVRKFPGYGKLSGKDIEELEAGARVEVDEAKKDPLDFALWKAAKPGEPKWPSPWGEGRPGWHIECSAMSTRYLGQPFDIHGGGRDLIFPHHENEIAQAEGAAGRQFARYWLHNGLININAEKMSKSLGNITAIGEMLKRDDAEAVRLFFFSNHYRSPIDYTQKAMAEARSSLDRFYETASRVEKIPSKGDVSDKPDGSPGAKDVGEALSSFEGRFEEAMDDDFNTARAIGAVFDVVRPVNRYLDSAGKGATHFMRWVRKEFEDVVRISGEVLGVFGSDAAEYRERCARRALASGGVESSEVERLVGERIEARKAKDFKRADGIRKALDAKGVELKDLPDGTTEWKVK